MASGDQQLVQTVTALHRENHGITKAEAELLYIREASSSEASTRTHNAHLYRLKHKKQEVGQGSVWLAICAKGIEIYERKKFEIRALNWATSGEKFTYYTNSDEKSKHLLFLCRETHQFSMAIQPRLSEVRRKEEEVSDRVQSLDESEDDLEIEIMINSPPAPSVESLALAHLRDAPDVLQARDSSVPSPRSHCSKGGDVESSTPPLVASQKQSPSGSTGIGGAATPATTDGSQCSSSCSTVVVAGAALAVSSGGCSGGTANGSSVPSMEARRRASTSSSLELGYSHTAQNSAVSDSASTCPELELDYSVQSAHTSSGIYTLRSSCATTADTIETNACSSETSGVYAVCSTNSMSNTSDSCHHVSGTYSVMGTSLDSNMRVRDRSGSSAGSVISASGSFRGDGSDPSEAGPRSPLTAEELSDLIVGRGSSSGHASGVYPSRATVSATLDSDSDYVTLPPPPMPPPRTDSDKNYLLLETASVTTASTTTPAALVSSALSIEDEVEDVISPPRPPPYTPQPLSQQNLLSQQKSLEHMHSYPHSQAEQSLLTHQALLTQQQHSLPTQQHLLQQTHSLSPQQSIRLLTPSHQQSSLMNLSLPIEEANARFITTKPHINILTAHTSLVTSTAAPSFAAPTLAYQTSLPCSSNMPPPPSNSQQLRLYPPGDARTHPPTHMKSIGSPHGVHSMPQQHASLGSSFVSYSGMADPGAKMKPTPVQTLVPIIGKNNYLDVHASRTNAASAYLMSPPPPQPPLGSQFHQRQFSPPPPPPVLHPRQPPPPPPSTSSQPSLATVYTSQVTRSQIEQFQQQMYSDVDYVIYPMKDPAVSKQEYMDAKQGSLIAHAAAMHYPYQQMACPPPPYPSYRTGPKSHFMYRSTPNVAVASGYLPMTFQSASPSPIKYASNQNLSSVEPLAGYASFSPSPYLSASHYSSASPLYSAGTSYSSSSTRSLRYEAPVPPFSSSAADLLHMNVSKLLPASTSHPPLGGFGRARSDDNILNSYEKPTSAQPLLERPKYRRLPPPPPPPPYDQQVSEKVSAKLQPAMSLESPKASAGDDDDVMLDIRTLREKSKNLDLPLISALCNDRSLLKQTNAFVMPRHPGPGGKQAASPGGRCERPVSWHVETDSKQGSASTEGKATVSETSSVDSSSATSKPQKSMLLASLLASKHSSYSSSKHKYPVSGLSTTQISKPQRKVSASTHIHPTHPHGNLSSSTSVKSGQSAVSANKLSTSKAQQRDVVLP
ncbi:hypothetical protein C0J52_04976 [Blattella germanica]|nr:hypothetical protein C0J52_04976 [Blattella germanica]